MFENASRPALTWASLDRAAHLRTDADALAALRADPRARALPFRRRDPLLTGDDLGSLGWRTLDDPLVAGGDLLFLGLADGAPRYAMGIADEAEAPEGEFVEMRAALLGGAFAGDAAAVASMGLALVNWHRTHTHCARCGEKTAIVQGGWRRDCPVCEGTHFPRTDPVVIMMIERDGHCAIARNVNFPEKLYSCIAGFVEPGECVEEAVARETREELGIGTGRIAYVSSQPWPFPMSLMMGCIAETTDTDFTLEAAEIADARWLSRADVKRLFEGGWDDMDPPRRAAIAGTLLHDWMDRRIGWT